MINIEKAGCRVYPVTVSTPYDVGDVNMYLLEEAGEITLIDAGMDSDDSWNALCKTLVEQGFTIHDVTQILITHNHADHIGLINRLASVKEIPVYAHQEAIYRMKRDPEFLSMRIRFFDQLYREMGCGSAGFRQVEKLKEAITLNEKMKVHPEITPLPEGQERIGSFQVIEVPGHSPDHVAFWDDERGWLFAGDHLIKHISSNAFVEPDREGNRRRTLVEYVESLRKCLSIEAKLTFSGHGDLIDDHRELIGKRLSRIQAKSEKVLNLIKGGASTAYELAQILYPSKYEKIFGPVMSEIIGLLDYLESNDRIQKAQKDHIWRYY